VYAVEFSRFRCKKPSAVGRRARYEFGYVEPLPGVFQVVERLKRVHISTLPRLSVVVSTLDGLFQIVKTISLHLAISASSFLVFPSFTRYSIG
jgi:hypothetical protein